MQTATLFANTSLCQANQFIFDDVYGNASNKRRYASNPKYKYYNALTQLQHRIGAHSPLYNKIFKLNDQPLNIKSTTSSHPNVSYHIQRINNLTYKIYKTKPIFHHIPQQKPTPHKQSTTTMAILQQYKNNNLNVRTCSRKLSQLRNNTFH